MGSLETTAKPLLSLALIVEPDRQRLARFVIDAVGALGGDVFSASVRVVLMLDTLRNTGLSENTTLHVQLMAQDREVFLEWDNTRFTISMLPAAPATPLLNKLAEQLRFASESADPELLKRRNRQISEDLERYMLNAAEQMAEMESMLEKKKQELEASIRHAETDALTGLYNRGAYDLRLRESLLRSQRQDEPMCLLLFDLDYFKQINDTYGHQFGDEYLKKMADVMRGSVREHVDILCRMGGDEFAAITFCDLKIAERIATKVLEGMNGKASIGIAQCRAEDNTQTLVARSDAALYEAKRCGRGRHASEHEMTPNVMGHP
jgi:diguanylate cyclase (GGDEF)-like protein